MSVTRAVMTGVGAALPKKIVTNNDLAKFVDTSDEWIRERTGIRQRHQASDGEGVTSLSVDAARKALAMAGVDPVDLDMIIVATTTPDETFPAAAVSVQAILGNTRGFAFDVQAACSGFVYAASIAEKFIRLGEVKKCLVIGAEVFSRILDYSDRATCVLFGDGAGAVVIEAGEGTGDNTDRGILTTHLHSDGRYEHLLYASAGTAKFPFGKVMMKGREVFRHAVVNLAEVVDEALESVNLTAKDIDWVVPHQANLRILEGTRKKLGMGGGDDRMVITVDRHANTSAASVPLALAEAVEDGRIQRGHLLLMEAMGAGLTWGSMLVRW